MKENPVEELYKKDLVEMGIDEVPDFVREDIFEVLKVKSEPGFSWSVEDRGWLEDKVQYLICSLKVAVMNGLLSTADAESIKEKYTALEGDIL